MPRRAEPGQIHRWQEVTVGCVRYTGVSAAAWLRDREETEVDREGSRALSKSVMLTDRQVL